MAAEGSSNSRKRTGIDADDLKKTVENSSHPPKKRKIADQQSLDILPDLSTQFDVAWIQKQIDTSEAFNADSYFRFKWNGGGFDIKTGKFDLITNFMRAGIRNEYELETEKALYTEWWENEKNFGNLKAMKQSMDCKLKYVQKMLATKQEKLSEIESLKQELTAKRQEYDK